ncbi:hypothetical protein [Streptomyces sp. SUK 48]|uniref:hypothetical protein n=1 Tax=Streptomyces sp. SUK 48 TaxID=2582831 RepID=UPI00129B52F0|nr:hypothetical protein [Streptomyces sp. SUK 48]
MNQCNIQREIKEFDRHRPLVAPLVSFHSRAVSMWLTFVFGRKAARPAPVTPSAAAE